MGIIDGAAERSRQALCGDVQTYHGDVEQAAEYLSSYD